MRVLLEDIGRALGVPATMAGAAPHGRRRLYRGPGRGLCPGGRGQSAGDACLAAVERGNRVLCIAAALTVDEAAARRLLNGAAVYRCKAADGRCRLHGPQGFLGTGLRPGRRAEGGKAVCRALSGTAAGLQGLCGRCLPARRAGCALPQKPAGLYSVLREGGVPRASGKRRYGPACARPAPWRWAILTACIWATAPCLSAARAWAQGHGAATAVFTFTLPPEAGAEGRPHFTGRGKAQPPLLPAGPKLGAVPARSRSFLRAGLRGSLSCRCCAARWGRRLCSAGRTFTFGRRPRRGCSFAGRKLCAARDI